MDQKALLPFDKPSNNNNQNVINVEKNKQKTLTLRIRINKFLFRCFSIEIILYALIPTLYIFIQIQIIPYWIEYILLFFLFANVIWTIPCALSVKKIEIIKNPYPNLITLKIIKRCGCSKQYTIMLENKYLLYHRDLILLNTLINPGDLDLDNSNIIKRPINFMYKYEKYTNMNGNCDEMQLKINEFLI